MAGTKGPDLTIANGTTTSGVWDLQEEGEIEDIDAIAIYAPSTLPEEVTIQTENASGDGFRDLYSSLQKVIIPANGHFTIRPVMFERVQVKAGAAVGAARTFGTRYLRKRG